MSFKHLLAGAAVVSAGFAMTTPAHAGPDEYIGQIMIGGWNFCPRQSAKADGQLLAINSNTALFSLYGTTYGGDGRTTFGLPDLRGRVPMHTGNGPGLTPRPLGQKGGVETVTLSTGQIPAHTHVAKIQTTGVPANTQNPRGDAFGPVADGADGFTNNVAPAGKFMHAGTVLVENAGGNQSHFNMQPYQVVMYCVVLNGIFPSRS